MVYLSTDPNLDNRSKSCCLLLVLLLSHVFNKSKKKLVESPSWRPGNSSRIQDKPLTRSSGFDYQSNPTPSRDATKRLKKNKLLLLS